MTGSVLHSPEELARRIGEQAMPTDEQRDAITAPLAPMVVVAGAGSGKTQTMGLRVVWLVANGLVEPHRVLGLTFTRKAAGELGERVRRMLRRLRGAHDAAPFLDDAVASALATGEPTVATYHSYAGALVTEQALRIGREPSTRLIGEAMSWQYAAEVVSRYDGDVAVERALSTVTGDVLALAGELAEHLQTPDDARALTERVTGQLGSLPRAAGQRGAGVPPPLRELLQSLTSRLDLLPMVEQYAARKGERNVMDYGDQVAVAATIAREHREVAELERQRFGAVLLDEYQDTGEAQRVLLTSLFRGHAVTAVGDPRQSIYGWRGASSGNLERFLADFADGPPADVAGIGRARSLSRSFRNTQSVLDVANAVAEDIPMRGLAQPALTPAPERQERGIVVCALHETAGEEADWIAARIQALHGDPDRPLDWGDIAVLVRRRSQFPLLEEALRARGVPCEVVGLGGLLLEPEVADVVATLHVLVDPLAGGSVVRLLAGPRWRLGPRDLDALGRRARRLAVRQPWAATTGSAATTEGKGAGDDDVGPGPAAADLVYDVVDERSLVDALDDLGPPGLYSEVGYRRLLEVRDEFRALRARTDQPLPELVQSVVSTIGLDVELASRPDVRPADAVRSLDRFVETAEEFVASGEDPGLLAFLGYLDTAEERERGLELDREDEADASSTRVQLMTCHAAKGLEWEAVFVAGLSKNVFPVEGRAVPDWTKQAATMPFPMRGDRAELPALAWEAATDQVQARATVEDFRRACKQRSLVEEQRLAYVAVTRARSVLGCSGYWWDGGAKTKRGASALLEQVRAACTANGGEVACWTPDPGEDAVNPVLGEPVPRPWPFDPLERRRPAVEAAAQLVTAAAAGRVGGGEPTLFDEQQAAAWHDEADLLLAELARHDDGSGRVVELPGHLSVSLLVELRRDPARLARMIRRPVPRKPDPLARRGTRFHLWLEQRWGQQRLIDIDELPGSADDTAEPDADLQALQAAFQASEWWSRAPSDVEWPFDLVVDGLVLRGRCDAVFTDAPDGLVDVVDWKTGRPKTGRDADVAAVQLAVYRLAWHHLTSVPLDRIRAAFHYVGANRTVRPADLLGHDELVALVRSVPVAATAGG